MQQYFTVIHEVGRLKGKNVPKCDHVIVLHLAESEDFCRHLTDFSLVECENAEVELWFLELPPSSHPVPLFPGTEHLNFFFFFYLLQINTTV